MSAEITTETPPYDLVASKQGYEIRRYYKQFWAQSTYEVPFNAEFSSGRDQGFFPLFNYISGNNNAQMKISMTTPVITQQFETERGSRRTMAFILSPSTFTSSNAVPRTNDGRVQLLEQGQIPMMACITFNMAMTNEGNAVKERQLREAAARDGLRLSPNKTDVLYARYNRPDTLPQYQRNEIWIPIVGQ